MNTYVLQLAADAARPYRWHTHVDGWGAWMWVVGPVWLLLLIGLAAFVTWLIVRTSSQPQQSGGNDARRILAERFARGEIDEEDYRRRSDLLR